MQRSINNQQDPMGLQHADGGAGNRAPQGNQTEHIVMNMWNSMKTLESKYIDLADYYKRELASNSSLRSNPAEGIGGPDLGSSSINTSKSAVGGVI